MTRWESRSVRCDPRSRSAPALRDRHVVGVGPEEAQRLHQCVGRVRLLWLTGHVVTNCSQARASAPRAAGAVVDSVAVGSREQRLRSTERSRLTASRAARRKKAARDAVAAFIRGLRTGRPESLIRA